MLADVVARGTKCIGQPGAPSPSPRLEKPDPFASLSIPKPRPVEVSLVDYWLPVVHTLIRSWHLVRSNRPLREASGGDSKSSRMPSRKRWPCSTLIRTIRSKSEDCRISGAPRLTRSIFQLWTFKFVNRLYYSQRFGQYRSSCT